MRCCGIVLSRAHATGIAGTYDRACTTVCPLTGQPLVESELRFDDALKTKITNWEVTKSLAVLAASPPDDANAKADLYDF